MGKRRVDYDTLIHEIQATYKKPKNKGKHIGVELECLSKNDWRTISEGLIDAGLEKYCQVTSDGSIDTDWEHGVDVEVCVIARQHSIVKIIKKVCRVLKNYECIVNDSCGLHVHIDMRNRSVKNSYKRLVNAQSILEKKVKPHRIKGEYSERNQCDDMNLVLSYDGFGDARYYKLDGELKAKYKHMEDKFQTAEEDQQIGRYLAINPESYDEHETIECRLHEGTLDSRKIGSWINLLVDIADGKVA